MKSTFHTVLDRTIMVEYTFFLQWYRKKSEVQATFFMLATKEREV